MFKTITVKLLEINVPKEETNKQKQEEKTNKKTSFTRSAVKGKLI